MAQPRSDERPPKRAWTAALMHGLSASVTGNSQAFGFSITVTATFGVLTSLHGNPSMLHLMGFALSAVLAFSLLNVVVAVLVKRNRPDLDDSRALLLGTATDFLAVGAGVGAAIGTGHLFTDWRAWLLAPFCAGVVYVLVQSLELAVGIRRAYAEQE